MAKLPDPVTREELYLAKLCGLRGFGLPEHPATRTEMYLAYLCNVSTELPERPVSRVEMYLAKLCGEDIALPDDPASRIELYLARNCGETVDLPEWPASRSEIYLNFLATTEITEASGDEITLENTIEGTYLTELRLLGTLEQDNYTSASGSKNFFCPVSTSGTNRTLVVSGNDIVVTVNSSTLGNHYALCPVPNSDELLGQTVTLGCTGWESPNDTTSGARLCLYGFNNSTRRVTGSNVSGTFAVTGAGSKTFEISDSYDSYATGTDSFAVLIYPDTAMTSVTGAQSKLSEVQLEIGSTATEYVPYSPSPLQAQPIQVAKGVQKVSVIGKNIKR